MSRPSPPIIQFPSDEIIDIDPDPLRNDHLPYADPEYQTVTVLPVQKIGIPLADFNVHSSVHFSHGYSKFKARNDSHGDWRAKNIKSIVGPPKHFHISYWKKYEEQSVAVDLVGQKTNYKMQSLSAPIKTNSPIRSQSINGMGNNIIMTHVQRGHDLRLQARYEKARVCLKGPVLKPYNRKYFCIAQKYDPTPEPDGGQELVLGPKQAEGDDVRSVLDIELNKMDAPQTTIFCEVEFYEQSGFSSVLQVSVMSGTVLMESTPKYLSYNYLGAAMQVLLTEDTALKLCGMDMVNGCTNLDSQLIKLCKQTWTNTEGSGINEDNEDRFITKNFEVVLTSLNPELMCDPKKVLKMLLDKTERLARTKAALHDEYNFEWIVEKSCNSCPNVTKKSCFKPMLDVPVGASKTLQERIRKLEDVEKAKAGCQNCPNDEILKRSRVNTSKKIVLGLNLVTPKAMTRKVRMEFTEAVKFQGKIYSLESVLAIDELGLRISNSKFTAFLKIKNLWYKYGRDVCEIGNADVFNCNPYILVYKKLESGPIHDLNNIVDAGSELSEDTEPSESSERGKGNDSRIAVKKVQKADPKDNIENLDKIVETDSDESQDLNNIVDPESELSEDTEASESRERGKGNDCPIAVKKGQKADPKVNIENLDKIVESDSDESQDEEERATDTNHSSKIEDIDMTECGSNDESHEDVDTNLNYSSMIEIESTDESGEDEKEEDVNNSHSSNTRQGQEDKNIRGDSDIMDHSDDSDVIKKPDCEESDILVKEVSDSNLLEDAKDDDKGDKVGKNGLTKNQRRKLNRKLKIEFGCKYPEGTAKEFEDYKEERTKPSFIVVENMSEKTAWQDLKDHMKKVGAVKWAKIHPVRKGHGMVEFVDKFSMERAIKELNGSRLNGRKIKLKKKISDKSG